MCFNINSNKHNKHKLGYKNYRFPDEKIYKTKTNILSTRVVKMFFLIDKRFGLIYKSLLRQCIVERISQLDKIFVELTI